MKLNCKFYLILIGSNLITGMVLDHELLMGRAGSALFLADGTGLNLGQRLGLEQRLNEDLLNE